MTPTRSALVEKVARAISDATLDWCGETPEIWDSHRIAAEAALRAVWEAMREPSEAMMERAGDAITREYAESAWEEAKEMAEALNPRSIYDTMLAASPLGEAIRDAE